MPTISTRLAAAVLAVLAVALCPSALAGPGPVPVSNRNPAPQGLKAFLLRTDEPAGRTFARTPSFAWLPVRGAARYEFELATSRKFTESTVVFANQRLKTPIAAIPMALPWMTGEPYALYARVRAVTRVGVSPWSAPYGFNMRWPNVPTPLASSPGLVRWSPVPGATRYHVWFLDAGKVFTTITNVADQREYYSFHQNQQWTGVVRWRVRAARWLFGGGPSNGLPAVSYGPWSPVYTSYNPPLGVGPIAPLTAVSDTTSTALHPRAHGLMPGFTYFGNQSSRGTGTELYRVYAFTDADCVNVVYRGAIVGSPAYAPRSTGPLKLPGNLKALEEARYSYLPDGKDEGFTYMADGMLVTTSEKPAEEKDGGSGTTDPNAPKTSIPESQIVPEAKVDLWDTDWPASRYYWTVVPVDIVVLADGSIVYRDAELPQDACDAGRVVTFGKDSEPVLVMKSSAPYASGLSPRGRLVAASVKRPVFYGTPLISWQPVMTADKYEVQWSKTAYPWVQAGRDTTFATSLTPPLGPGTWYYRVRGINFSLPGPRPELSWSRPVAIRVAKPLFRVLR